MRFGHYGVVRELAAPAPEIVKPEGGDYPYYNEAGEFIVLDDMSVIQVKQEEGRTIRYTTDGTDPVVTSNEAMGGFVSFIGMNLTEAGTTVKIASFDAEGESSKVTTVVVKKTTIPAVTLPAVFVNGQYEYTAATTTIHFDKPAAGTIVYTTDGSDPTDKTNAAAKVLGADGNITLSDTKVNQVTQLKLAIRSGEGDEHTPYIYGPVTTALCLRIQLVLNRPVVTGYAADFTASVKESGDSYWLELTGFDAAGMRPFVSTEAIVLAEPKVLLGLGSDYAFSAAAAEGAKFVEVQVSTSPTPDLIAKNAWTTATYQVKDNNRCLVIKEDKDDYGTFGVNMISSSPLLTEGVNDCYIHLRATNMARTLMMDPTDPSYATSEVTTVRIVRARPAKPATPELKYWHGSYKTESNTAVVSGNWSKYDAGTGISLADDRLLLRLATPAAGTILQFRLTGSPDAAGAGTAWITPASGLSATGIADCLLALDSGNNLTFGTTLFNNGGSARTAVYVHLRAVTTENADAYEFVSSDITTARVERARPQAPKTPQVVKWAGNFTYATGNGTAEDIFDLAEYKDGSVISLDDNRLILQLSGKDVYGLAGSGKPVLEYQLSNEATADENGHWQDQKKLDSTADAQLYNLVLLEGFNMASDNLFFKYQLGQGYEFRPEVYLHLRAVTTTDHGDYSFAASSPLTIRIMRKSPASPEFEITGIHTERNNIVSYINNISWNVKAPLKDNQKIEVAWVSAVDGSPWPGAEPDFSAWTDATKADRHISKSGRLYSRVVDPTYGSCSRTVIKDFEVTPATMMSVDGWKTLPSGTLVQLIDVVKITGTYITQAQTGGTQATAYVYVINETGHVIKLVISGTAEALNRKLNELGYYNGGGADRIIPARGVIAVLNKQEGTDAGGTMPELLVTDGSTSYLDYLQPVSSDAFQPNEPSYSQLQDNGGKPRTSIDIDKDFNRLVTMRSLLWTGRNSKMAYTDATGAEATLTLYNRLNAPGYDYDADVESLVAGKLYSVTGYVGQLNGELALFPVSATRQCPGTPTLYAPNIIEGEPDADGYIATNAISEAVVITPRGNANGESRFWYAVGKTPGFVPGILSEVTDGSFSVDLSAVGDLEKVYVQVFAELNGMKSLKPAKVAITSHPSTTVASIAEFKGKATEPGADRHYRMGGKAVIREITPYYLYVSDCSEAGTPEAISSSNTILIYNSYGWENPIVEDKAGNSRRLAKGDIITGFALVPHKGIQLNGNILDDATGYARTFRYAGETDETMEPEELDPATAVFDETSRMTYVRLKGVSVKRTGTSEEDYVYTLQLPAMSDKPELTFAVFPRTQGWHTMWRDGQGFTITGVVVRNDDDETGTTPKYALAPTAFEADATVSGALDIYLEGIGGEGKNAPVQTFVGGGKVVIEYTAPAAENGYDHHIYYTVNGADPRNDVASRTDVAGTRAEIELGEEDMIVRAFVGAGGLNPGTEVMRTFRHNVKEMQYILNFLNSAREGQVYKLTDSYRIQATGGDYMFIAGPVGHFLPVYRRGGWDSKYAPGKYISDMFVQLRVDEAGNRMADVSGLEIPEPLDESAVTPISVAPDEVARLSEAKARRLVTVRNVTLSAAGTAAYGARAAAYTISSGDDDTAHPLADGILGAVTFSQAGADGTTTEITHSWTDGEAYDITGFVMLGEKADGESEAPVELWPLSAVHLVRTPAPQVSLQKGIVVETDDKGELKARFRDMVAVTITPANIKGIRTMYSYDNATWFDYVEPIAVSEACMIHAKAIAPGMTESDHTHLTLVKYSDSGDILISVEPAERGGKVTVTLSAVDTSLDADSYSIRYTTDGTNPTAADGTLYTAPFDLLENAVVKALLVENGKEAGKIARAYVTVPPVVEDPEPEEPEPAVMAGRVKFDVIKIDDKTLVSLSPDNSALTDWKIRYRMFSDAASEADAEWQVYDGTPLTVSETCVIAAYVEYKGVAGVTAEVTVWVSPSTTAIENVGSDGSDSGVSVSGSDIIAPEGSEVYDLSGRRVSGRDLTGGVYIVRLADGKAVKVIV